jgi:hypothetical protein
MCRMATQSQRHCVATSIRSYVTRRPHLFRMSIQQLIFAGTFFPPEVSEKREEAPNARAITTSQHTHTHTQICQQFEIC